MVKTRIIEVIIDGSSCFYPQYLGWFRIWRNFKKYFMGCYIEDINFIRMKEAQKYLEDFKYQNRTRDVKIIIHS